MLGAASGASRAGIAAMGFALALRVYTVVLLPGLALFWLVTRPWGARAPGAETGDAAPESEEPAPRAGENADDPP
jgi:hypothetical protein